MPSYFKASLIGITLAALIAGCPVTQAPAPGQTGCAADHPKVGMTAVIEGISHGVAGTARIVDNCTIVIEHFYYDGIALDPHVVGGKADDSDLIVLSESIFRLGGYQDETLTVTLPEGVTLDDIERIGIACIPLGVFPLSFGAGTFQ